MINDKKVLALIPARGGSKGLPRKNVLSFCNHPLVSWPVQVACRSKYIDRVIVSTEDDEIAAISLRYGADVPFKRPEELASDIATSADVIKHTIEFLNTSNEKYDYIVLLEPTSPLTETDDVDKALEILVSNRSLADAIVGVSEVVSTHPVFTAKINQEGLITPFLENGFSLTGRRQDIEAMYFFDGSIYISDTSIFMDKATFYHNRTLPYITPKWKSIEIDDIVDFICAEAIMQNIKHM